MSAMPLSVGSQTASWRLANDWSDKMPTAPMLVPGTGSKNKNYLHSLASTSILVKLPVVNLCTTGMGDRGFQKIFRCLRRVF
jgi:hypothetical protein